MFSYSHMARKLKITKKPSKIVFYSPRPLESILFFPPAPPMEVHSVFIHIKSLGETQGRHSDLHSGHPDIGPRSKNVLFEML